MLLNIYQYVGFAFLSVWIALFVITRIEMFIKWLNDSYDGDRLDDAEESAPLLLVFLMTTVAWPATIIILVFTSIAYGLREAIRKIKEHVKSRKVNNGNESQQQ